MRFNVNAISPGTHLLIVKDAELSQSSSGEDMVVVHCETQDGQMLRDFYTGGFGNRKITFLCRVTGLIDPNESCDVKSAVEDFEQFKKLIIGKTFGAEIAQGTYNGKIVANIVEYMTPDEIERKPTVVEENAPGTNQEQTPKPVTAAAIRKGKSFGSVRK